MQKSEIKIGEDYALRETPKPDAPLQRIRILQHVRGKNWKAEWIEPNQGLVDYVESKDLLARWKDLKRYLRDEESERRLREHNERQGYKADGPLDKAITEVFDAVGETELSFYKGILSGPPDVLERVKARARFDKVSNSMYTYTNRHGIIRIPFNDALEIAKAFCAAEPSTVLISVESTERKWSHDALQPGGDYLISLLNEYRAVWALVRQWAGQDAAIAQREARIQELERMVWDAVYALQKAGDDDQAIRLRRAIQRG